MSETTQAPARTPRPIEAFRERAGGLSPRLKQFVQAQNNAKRLIRAALESGPRTVPQLATAIKLEASVVLWHVMAMRRYGQLVEFGIEGSYPSYALKED